jgi:hypothetical protein
VFDGTAEPAQHDAAYSPIAHRMPQAAVQGDHQTAPMARGGYTGDGQHGEILARVRVHHVDRTRHPQRGGQGRRRPKLPQHRQPHPGALDDRALAIPRRPGRPCHPGGEHRLRHAKPVKAPGQLPGMGLHAADRVVGCPATPETARLEHRAEPDRPQTGPGGEIGEIGRPTFASLPG